MVERKKTAKAAVKKPARQKKKAPTKKAAGRPEFTPTDEQRQNVEILIAGGMGLDEVAHAIGVAENTLKKHFPQEIKVARSKKRAEVLVAMFNSAKGGNVSAQKAFIALNGAASADEDFVGRNDPAPAKPAKVSKLGKKEQAAEEAAIAAGGGDGWGKDLDVTTPVPGTKPN